MPKLIDEKKLEFRAQILRSFRTTTVGTTDRYFKTQSMIYFNMETFYDRTEPRRFPEIFRRC